jgi:DNA relaxase NicK
VENYEMPAKSIFCGVDYIRLTAADHKPFGVWQDICLPELLREEAAGRKAHKRWVLGYYGAVGEHCFVGEREDGCMIQLSGRMAWDRWYDASNHSKKATRIDLQVTWPLDGEPGQYIHDLYYAGMVHKPVNGRPPQLTLTDTPEGAKMLTVGNRQSLLYGRCYDKYRESKMPEYRSCVRWEIEVKAEQAVDLTAYLREHRSEAATTRAIVSNFWSQRGMPPFWDTYEALEEPPPMKRSKTDETKLAWLAAQVAPTIKALKDHNRITDALRAILKDALTDEQIESILWSVMHEVE